MTTSQTTTQAKKQRMKMISRGEFAYICSRNQFAAHDLLIRAIKESGLTQKQLSELTGIDEASISRLLRRPRNIELNTLSKLFYAACGAALNLSASFPKQGSSLSLQSLDGRANKDTSNILYVYLGNGDARSRKIAFFVPIHSGREQNIYPYDKPTTFKGDTSIGEQFNLKTMERIYA